MSDVIGGIPTAHHAEVATVVEDSYQKNGIGTHLSICWLPPQEHGIDTVEVEVLHDKRRITKMMQQSGL